MIIILEGPDGSGKTVLGEAIAKECGFVYRHEHNEPTLGPRGLLERYLGAATSDNTVFDRMAISELIYSKAMNRQDRIGVCGLAMVLNNMRKVGGSVRTILCLPPLAACLNTLEERGDYLVNQKILTDVHHAYTSFDFHWNFRYDRTRPNALEAMIAEVKTWLK